MEAGDAPGILHANQQGSPVALVGRQAVDPRAMPSQGPECVHGG